MGAGTADRRVPTDAALVARQTTRQHFKRPTLSVKRDCHRAARTDAVTLRYKTLTLIYMTL